MQCNTANLIVNHGWQGFLFDGDAKNVSRGNLYYKKHKDTWRWPPRFKHAWITAENVNDILCEAGATGEVDLLSLDVDGMDYWIWQAIESIQPRVVVCEAHNVIGPEKSLTVPYDPHFKIETPDYHGASLAAMTKLARRKGYRLVGTHRYGFNAFFIRNGLAENLLPAASVADCLQHPCAQHARAHNWPKVRHLPWQEIE